MDISAFIGQAAATYQERKTRDAQAKAENEAAAQQAAQGKAESILRPLLDSELTPETQAALGITVKYIIWEGDVRPYADFAIPDYDGQIKRAVTERWEGNRRVRNEQWEVKVEHLPSDTRATWSGDTGHLEDTVRIAIGEIAAKLKARKEENARILAERAELTRREKEREAAERERKRHAFAVALRDAIDDNEELGPVIEAEVARINAILRPPITVTLYKATWQTGYRVDPDYGDGEIATATGWAFADAADDSGYIRVNIDGNWRTVKPNPQTLVWERVEVTPETGIPNDLLHYAAITLTVRGVRMWEVNKDPDGNPVNRRLWINEHNSAWYIHFDTPCASWLLAELGYPMWNTSYTLDLRDPAMIDTAATAAALDECPF